MFNVSNLDGEMKTQAAASGWCLLSFHRNVLNIQRLAILIGAFTSTLNFLLWALRNTQ